LTKDEEFKKELTATYFGAAGSKARAVLENRFKIFAYDKQKCPEYKDAALLELKKIGFHS